jgi:hypothetical protein
MIELTCTKCQTVLTLDDAFAGGVCRCKQCGAIQTVPSRLKPSDVAPEIEAANNARGARNRVILLVMAAIVAAMAVYFLWRAGWVSMP